MGQPNQGVQVGRTDSARTAAQVQVGELRESGQGAEVAHLLTPLHVQSGELAEVRQGTQVAGGSQMYRPSMASWDGSARAWRALRSCSLYRRNSGGCAASSDGIVFIGNLAGARRVARAACCARVSGAQGETGHQRSATDLAYLSGFDPPVLLLP